MEKIRYRLVFNRKNTLNKEGKALVQVEATLNAEQAQGVHDHERIS